MFNGKYKTNLVEFLILFYTPYGPYIFLSYLCKVLQALENYKSNSNASICNDQLQVLVVQEKYCAPAFVGLWKIPTGFIVEV